MKRADKPSSLTVAWTAIFVVACGPGVQEGPVPESKETSSMDTGDADTDTNLSDRDTMGGDSDDTETSDSGTTLRDTASDSDLAQDWCPSTTIEETVALTAEQVLSESVFVALDSECILAARQEADGYTVAAAFLSGDTENKIVFVSSQQVPLRPGAMACRYDAEFQVSTAYVVTSDDAQGIVYELTSNEGQWREIFRGPRLFGVQQMYRTADPKVDELCVFGDGASCAARSEGWTEWRPEIAPGSGVAVRDMALIECEEGFCLAAIGDAGFVSIKRQSVWQSVVVETTADLTAISVLGNSFSAVGTGGTFLYGDATGLESYRILDGQNMVSLKWYGTRSFMGATAEGTVFQGEMQSDGPYICPSPSVISWEILNGDFFNCKDTNNYVVLQADALIGRYDCTLVVMI